MRGMRINIRDSAEVLGNSLFAVLQKLGIGCQL